ncbi:hypothetical protein ACFQX7_05195 [Luedemannella flava]
MPRSRGTATKAATTPSGQAHSQDRRPAAESAAQAPISSVSPVTAP